MICDNASTDETPEICRSYTDPRVRYCRFEELVNQAGNFNRCLKEACGEFITLLHSDDLLLPGFLADRASRLERNPGPGFVFGAVEIIDEKGERISISKRWAEDRRLDSEELVGSLLMACIVSPPSLMVKKSVADTAGPFRTDLTWGHDWEWTIRLAGIAAAEYSAAPWLPTACMAQAGRRIYSRRQETVTRSGGYCERRLPGSAAMKSGSASCAGKRLSRSGVAICILPSRRYSKAIERSCAIISGTRRWPTLA